MNLIRMMDASMVDDVCEVLYEFHMDQADIFQEDKEQLMQVIAVPDDIAFQLNLQLDNGILNVLLMRTQKQTLEGMETNIPVIMIHQRLQSKQNQLMNLITTANVVIVIVFVFSS